MTDVLEWLTLVGLGCAVIALVIEGTWLVPMWKRMPPPEFRDWYQRHAKTLVRVFGPLEIVPTVSALVWLLAGVFGDDGFSWPALGALAGSVGVLLFFPVYFAGANTAFEHGPLADADVPAALRTWGIWHWARTAVAALGFVFAAVGVAS